MSASNYAVPASQFFNDFPEFLNFAFATTDRVNFWSAIAFTMLSQTRLQSQYTLMAELFIAHHLVLQALHSGTVATGGIPGINTGAIAGEGAGAVNISYNSDSVLRKDAAHWNYTDYGVRFHLLGWQFGAGPQQVGPGGCGPGVTAWGGPPWYPW